MKRILYILIGVVCSLSVQAQTVSEQLKAASNLTVFNQLVSACNLQDELSKVEDVAYAELYQAGMIDELPILSTENKPSYVPEHRYYGYTVFAETDAFWQQALGKKTANISVTDVENYVTARGQTLREFVTYHILPVKLAKDKLVIHYNERGYNYRTNMAFTVPTYELYTTIDGTRLLKLYQCGPSFSVENSGDVFLNRTPVLDNGINGNLHEISVSSVTAGIRVDTAQVVSGVNGYIYPISSLLLYSDAVRQQVLGGRLRFDMAGLFPELMNNDIRANRIEEKNIGIPVSSVYQYCDGLEIQDRTQFYYLSGLGRDWYNWQGDEFNILGQVDFTLRLPPVPNDGEYELRIGTQSNTSYRNIVQFYMGTNKESLSPAGLSVDMREGGTVRRTPAGNLPSRQKWEADNVNDSISNRMIDLRLYEAGVLKGPRIYSFTPGSTNYARDAESTLRRIIWRGQLKAGETYYLRVQGLLDDKKQAYLDYMEWCPRSVYANPNEPEDTW